jgi:hypothetical protein
MIYEYGLVNPILGHINSVSRYDNYGSTVKYELSAPLLSTCRKISEEASKVLYEKNKFYLACLPSMVGTNLHSRARLSPITRHQSQGDLGFPSIRENPAVSKVLH